MQTRCRPESQGPAASRTAFEQICTLLKLAGCRLLSFVCSSYSKGFARLSERDKSQTQIWARLGNRWGSLSSQYFVPVRLSFRSTTNKIDLPAQIAKDKNIPTTGRPKVCQSGFGVKSLFGEGARLNGKNRLGLPALPQFDEGVFIEVWSSELRSRFNGGLAKEIYKGDSPANTIKQQFVNAPYSSDNHFAFSEGVAL
jgi:hypothetical protein